MNQKEIEVSYKFIHRFLEKIVESRNYKVQDFSAENPDDFSDATKFIVGVAKGLFSKELPDQLALLELAYALEFCAGDIINEIERSLQKAEADWNNGK